MNSASTEADKEEGVCDEPNGIIVIDPDSTSAEAEKQTFAGPEHEIKVLTNRQFAQDMAERRKYARAAFKLTRLWVCFLMCSTGAQFTLSLFDKGLSTGMFVALVTTTTVSVLGVWALVGNYLFRRP